MHRKTSAISVVAAVVAGLLSMPVSMPALAQTQPMDALTGAEIRAAAAILEADARTRDATYQLITLKEMPKAEVLAWKPGMKLRRLARATAVAGDKVLEADLDLAAGTITNLVERSNVEAPLTLNELGKGVYASDDK